MFPFVELKSLLNLERLRTISIPYIALTPDQDVRPLLEVMSLLNLDVLGTAWN